MLLSVIIVTKNPGDDIYPTLSSLKKLDISDVEILIKDNSSTKGVETVIQEFQFSNLRYIHSEDDGVYDAMNQAIDEAEGKFIYFLNAGDIYLECDLIQTLRINDTRIDFYYGDIVNLRPYVRLVQYSTCLNKYSAYLRTLCHQSIVIKKEVFSKLGKFDTNLNIHADYLFSLKLLDNFQGKSLHTFIAIYKGGGLSYGYQQTDREKEYLKNKLREIYSAPEIWILYIASSIVKFLVFLKNFNKRT